MPKRVQRSGPTPGLDEFLCFAIYTAGHAFTRVYKPLLDALDLTYPQYLVMVALWAKDDQTVGSLGDQMLLESNTLTPLLKRLEAMGYVARRRDETDERQVRVRLTESGAALRAKARDVPRCILEATGLSAAELERLRAEIAALRENLVAADRVRPSPARAGGPDARGTASRRQADRGARSPEKNETSEGRRRRRSALAGAPSGG